MDDFRSVSDQFRSIICHKRNYRSNNYTTKLENLKLAEGKVDTCIEILRKDKDTDVQDVLKDGRHIYLYPWKLNLLGVKCMVHVVR